MDYTLYKQSKRSVRKPKKTKSTEKCQNKQRSVSTQRGCEPVQSRV